MNIITIFERFSTQQDCIKHLEEARWHGQVTCPYCASDNTAPLQHRHRCYACRTAFSVTVRTIFHHTHMPPYPYAPSEVVPCRYPHSEC